MSDIRALVVEDSLTIRKYIVNILSSAPGIEVVAEAQDGKAAIELCQRLRPDVVTMDMLLPVMTGVQATEHIMAYCPTPILIVSASTNRGDLFKTYDALAAGAVDVLEKPMGVEVDREWEHRLVSAVKMISRIKVITHPRARLGGLGQAPLPSMKDLQRSSKERRLVVIGASTGGPGAVRTVLQALPRSFPLPVLVVLHISELFGPALAEWLNAQVPFSVRYAIDGERLPPPGQTCALMAPPQRHLELQGERLRLTDGPEIHSCKPSVDALFESAACEMGKHTIGCLLTGMGKDGARGLLAIRRAHGLTIAQDEATSVVFGMPGEAIKLEAASRVLPLSEIGGALGRAVWGAT